LTDGDGHEYLDFLGEYTAGLYGHSNAVIVDAIREALADGFVLGAPEGHFTSGPVQNEDDVPESAELRGLLHLHMLERDFSYGRRGFIALSLPLGEADIDAFATALEEFLVTI
jgi:glutamate-1-semialdehyde aminotransferase